MDLDKYLREAFDGTGHLNPRYSTWYPDGNAGNSRADGEVRASLNGGFLNDRFTSAERDATVNRSKEARVEGYDGDPKEHCADYGFGGFDRGPLDFPLGGEKASIYESGELRAKRGEKKPESDEP